MSSLDRLKAANSLSDVAELLGFKPRALAYLVRKSPVASRYTQFEIPKRSGGSRLISAPNAKLCLLQSRLAKLLAECEAALDAKKDVKRHLSHGFRKGYSILSNAEVHRRRRFVLNVDLKDFFGTIHFGRVLGYFENNRDFLLKREVATVIAQIACHDAKLPQGSPCSPIISNLIGLILDIHLSKLARNNGCSYTRYADDLTFSTNRSEFPEALALPVGGKLKVGLDLEALVLRCGFKVNEQKTRLQFSRSRQDVTGIIVNQYLNSPIEYRRLLRAMVHKFCSTGGFTRPCTLNKDNEEKLPAVKAGTPAQLQGMLSFAYQVEQWRSRNAPAISGANTPMEKLFQRFIYYKEFAAPSIPAVVFEGKTDSIYLREALRQSVPKFPLLAVGKGDKFKIRLKLHRESKLMKKLFHLTSGGDPLKNFIKDYRAKFAKVEGPKGQCPVIVLIDNDDGFKPAKGVLENFYKIKFVIGVRHFHVTDNLYILLTSPYGAAPHCIEDCFDAKTRARKLGAKSFTPKNDFDPLKYYGKDWFAEKVVKPNSASIDFGGFDGILAEIEIILKLHALKIGAP